MNAIYVPTRCLYILLAVVLFGCDGPTGPEGPPGPAGADGEPGLTTHLVPVSASDVSRVEGVQRKMFRALLDVPELTLEVLSLGSVFVQFKDSFPLPYTEFIGDESLQHNYTPEPGRIVYWLLPSIGLPDEAAVPFADTLRVGPVHTTPEPAVAVENGVYQGARSEVWPGHSSDE